MSASLTAPRSRSLVTDERPGSVWQQVLVGFVGIALAIGLVVGQIAVATTAGIQKNVAANIVNLKKGNETMKEILEKATPVILVEKVVAEQQKTLANTLDTMEVLNGQMAAIGVTTAEMSSTVSQMQATSESLASGVAGMESDTQSIATMLEPLPAATDSTGAKLNRIAADSTAINGELNSISGKMSSYGLPQAKGVKRR